MVKALRAGFVIMILGAICPKLCAEWISGTKGWKPVGDTLSTTARVGIGTTGPEQKLHVYSGDSNCWVNSESGINDIAGFYMKNANTTAWMALRPDHDNALMFDANGVNTMVLKSGNVGIGTTSPKAKLDVNSSMSKITTATYIISVQPPSGATTSIACIDNYGTQTMVVARVTYVQIYAWAGSGLGTGMLLAATRRANDNSIWTDIDDVTVSSTQSSTTEPTLFWDNGILKITTGASNAGIVTIEITARSCDITPLVK